MKCPYCQSRDARVIDSREISGGESIRRRRECTVCVRRFTTYERVEAGGLIVVKKDGRRQEWDPAKLRQKLRVALTKRPIGEREIDAIVQRVEAEMLALGTQEIPSHRIGEAVLHSLKETDQVAYIRYASVYRSFADLEDLSRAVQGLQEEQNVPAASSSASDSD